MVQPGMGLMTMAVTTWGPARSLVRRPVTYCALKEKKAMTARQQRTDGQTLRTRAKVCAVH